MSATSRKRALTSSAVTPLPSWTTQSVSEPSGTGARTETPSTLPFSSGMTTPLAFAATLEERVVAAAKPLGKTGAPHTAESVAGAVAACMAAIELVDDRAADYASIDASTLIADSAFNHGSVFGHPVRGDELIGDLGDDKRRQATHRRRQRGSRPTLVNHRGAGGQQRVQRDGLRQPHPVGQVDVVDEVGTRPEQHDLGVLRREAGPLEQRPLGALVDDHGAR